VGGKEGHVALTAVRGQGKRLGVNNESAVALSIWDVTAEQTKGGWIRVLTLRCAQHDVVGGHDLVAVVSPEAGVKNCAFLLSLCARC
jgi:hypothetical protein